jgi:hypothetical protein
MLKSTVVKWAVAALLTVPAGSLIARPLSRHKLSAHARTHRMLTSSYRSRSHLLAHHSLHSSKLTAMTKRGHRLSALRRHSAVHTASFGPGYRLKITKMPPTIDNIGA